VIVQTIQTWFNDKVTSVAPEIEAILKDAAASPDAEAGVVPLPTPRPSTTH
jgi:hypothetical protein